MKSTFKVLFYLKKDKISKDGKVPVMGRITVNGTQAGFSCKLNIDPALWDEKTNYLKSQRNTLSREIHQMLENIKAQIIETYGEDRLDEILEKPLDSEIRRSVTVMRMSRPIRSRMLTMVSATDIKRLSQLSTTTPIL